MELDRRTTLKALGSVLAIGTFGASSATAGGGTAHDTKATQAVALDYLANDSVLSNTELETILQSLADENSDTVSVSEIGESNQERPIYVVAIGSGDTDVMAIGQQHGDEMVSSAEGLLAAAQYLASEDDQSDSLTEELTVHLVPRVNPDGFVARQREGPMPIFSQTTLGSLRLMKKESGGTSTGITGRTGLNRTSIRNSPMNTLRIQSPSHAR